MILYMSEDDGALYDKVDESERFTAYEVPDKFELTAEQCCRGYGQILQILILAGKATRCQK